MWCAHCGTEINDDALFCSSCGTKVARVESQANASVQSTPSVVQPQEIVQQGAVGSAPADPMAQPQYQSQSNAIYINNVPQTSYPRESNSGMLLAAFILNLISTIALAFAIIPLAWCIPMTVHSYGIYKGTKPNTVAFGVCTLLFVNIIGGILMLVADKDE